MIYALIILLILAVADGIHFSIQIFKGPRQ